MSIASIQLLRVLHIVLGAVWVGVTFFLVMFLMPTLRSLGPAGAPVMQEIGGRRKLPLYMMFVPILTVLSGFALFMHDSNATNGLWMRSGPGRMFGVGGVLALIAIVLGMTVNSPTGKRATALATTIRARGGPPTPDELAEMSRLQARLEGASRISAVLILLTTLTMAIARYMPF